MNPSPRALILNLLLGHRGPPLTARAAIASCAVFGLRENSVRVTLARLAAAGLVEAAGRGAYRLGPGAEQLAAEVATWRDVARRVTDWKGGWIAVHAAELGRSDRAALRVRDRALGLLGMRELDRHLWLRPDNLAGGVARARERLHRLGLEPAAAVFVARDLDAARERRARALWDGDALSAGYAATRRRLDDWLDRAGTMDADSALRESFVLGNDAIRQLVFDPLLPEPLVDARERAAFIDAVTRFDVAGHAIWNRFLQEGLATSPPRPAQSREETSP